MVFLNLKIKVIKLERVGMSMEISFVNVFLVALDDCNEKNGLIEIANRFKKNDFEYLIEFTKKNGTHRIKYDFCKKCKFEKIV